MITDTQSQSQRGGPPAPPPSAEILRLVAERKAAEQAAYGPSEESGPAFPRLSDWRAAERFTGPAPRREYLIDGVFPMGQPSLLAATGGTGKSFQLLSLARDVALGAAGNVLPPDHFGGCLKASGTAVYISAEDDAIEIHSRLEAMGGSPDRLIAIPLPSTEGIGTLFELDPVSRRPTATGAWESLTAQLSALPDLALVALDPLQALCTLDLNLPEHAQSVCNHLRGLCLLDKGCFFV